MSFGFSAETAAANAAAATQAAMRRESHVPSVNVTPTSHDLATGVYSCLFRYMVLPNLYYCSESKLNSYVKSPKIGH